MLTSLKEGRASVVYNSINMAHYRLKNDKTFSGYVLLVSDPISYKDLRRYNELA